MSNQSSTARAWATGGVVFASTMMVILGIWQVFVGIAAIVDDDFFIVGPNYTYNIDTSAWGWIHLILGAVSILAGIGLLSGATWARVIGMIFAGLTMINNFIFLPYYPLWSLTVIALSVFIIWALATTNRDPLE